MFKKILVANRGEIAVRVIRACRELGIRTAAVYSEADRASLHIRLAGEAYYIGPAQSSQSYLNKQKIISLAEEIKADAIHPGYGFLSENPEFIKMLEDKKIPFIGPSSKSAGLMGNKIAARNLMRENGIPIVPGTLKPVSSEAEGKKAAEEIGYPVILKAGGGGGGKGMKKVFSEKEFLPAFESASREALNAFGNPEIYIEKFFESPKHIEVQIIADKHGNYAHLFERECSAQRRYQKVVEEAPSSFVDAKTREKITEAALFAAQACGYYNAGTIEFLMDRERNFYFLEMNTRIQVEHPVTEMITGIDLVKEQISVAAGNQLSFKQEHLKINGHAVECRICAEDFRNNFLPSAGEIYYYREPSGNGIRVDSGFNQHSKVSINYDSLIAKLICHSYDRNSAIKKSEAALAEFNIAGVITNTPFLASILNHGLFTSGTYDINFIEKQISELNEKAAGSDENMEEIAALFAAALKSVSVNKKRIKKAGNNKWTDLIYE